MKKNINDYKKIRELCKKLNEVTKKELTPKEALKLSCVSNEITGVLVSIFTKNN